MIAFPDVKFVSTVPSGAVQIAYGRRQLSTSDCCCDSIDIKLLRKDVAFISLDVIREFKDFSQDIRTEIGDDK